MVTSMKSHMPMHRKPVLRNVFLSVLFVGAGTLFIFKKVGRDVLPIDDTILGFVMAAGCIIGGLHMLYKTFEMHVIRF